MVIQPENAIPTDITLIGAGGHAKVVADIIIKYCGQEFSIVDSAIDKVGSQIQEKQVLLLDDRLFRKQFHIAIGENKVRQRCYYKYKTLAEYTSIISPDAYIVNSATINDGSFVAAKAVISADTQIGIGCIINHGAVVDHDCLIGQFSHIAPNATLLGGVTLGERVFVGSGATVLPGVKVASDVVIGAGAVVLSDISDGCTVVGLPAKKIKEYNES